MINNARISSGYDIEVNIGSQYLKNVLNAALEANTFNVPFVNISGITSVVIIPNNPDYNLELTIEHDSNLFASPINLLFELSIGENNSSLSHYGDINGYNIGSIPLDGLNFSNSNVVDYEFRVLPGNSTYQNSYGIYLNIDLSIMPIGFPDIPNVARGDINNIHSIIPHNKDFAIGFSKASFERFANDMWHEMSDDNYIDEIEGADFRFKNIQIIPKTNYIETKLELEKIIDNFWDPTINVDANLSVNLVNGDVVNHVEHVNVDISDWYMIFFTPLFIIKFIAEKFLAKLVQNNINGNILTPFMSLIPKRQPLFSKPQTPFDFEIEHVYTYMNLNSLGLSLAGNAPIVLSVLPYEPQGDWSPILLSFNNLNT